MALRKDESVVTVCKKLRRQLRNKLQEVTYLGWSGGAKTKHSTSRVGVDAVKGGQKPYRTISGK